LTNYAKNIPRHWGLEYGDQNRGYNVYVVFLMKTTRIMNLLNYVLTSTTIHVNVQRGFGALHIISWGQLRIITMMSNFHLSLHSLDQVVIYQLYYVSKPNSWSNPHVGLSFLLIMSRLHENVISVFGKESEMGVL
jgi:hypothetical protein